jgi:iron(III) transport system substrate-binding protein
VTRVLLRAPVHLCLCALLAGCGGGGKVPLVIYSPHGRDLLSLFERRFEAEHPTVDVRWLDMGSQEALDRVRSERANPQADLWFGGPVSLFESAAHDSLLAPLVDDSVYYLSVYRTPAVIAYNRAAVPDSAAPKDWDDVLAPRWKDRVVIREPLASGTMRAIWGMLFERSLAATGDTARAAAWLRRLDGQTRQYVMNPALMTEMMVRGDAWITLWDLPDLQITIRDGRDLGYVFPSSGTPVIDDAIAVVRGAKHAELARAFVAWVRSPAIQLLAAREVYRLPARTDLPADSLPAWVRQVEATMKPAPMDWKLLQERGAEWMAYWDRHIRGTGRSGS